MIKTLRDSLVDHDMALLRGLAEARGAVLSSNHRLTAAEELGAQLITPGSLSIAMAAMDGTDSIGAYLHRLCRRASCYLRNSETATLIMRSRTMSALQFVCSKVIDRKWSPCE